LAPLLDSDDDSELLQLDSQAGAADVPHDDRRDDEDESLLGMSEDSESLLGMSEDSESLLVMSADDPAGDADVRTSADCAGDADVVEETPKKKITWREFLAPGPTTSMDLQSGRIGFESHTRKRSRPDFALLKDPGILLKDPGVLLKDPGVLLKDPGVL